jgi:hypothetical protein
LVGLSSESLFSSPGPANKNNPAASSNAPNPRRSSASQQQHENGLYNGSFKAEQPHNQRAIGSLSFVFVNESCCFECCFWLLILDCSR